MNIKKIIFLGVILLAFLPIATFAAGFSDGIISAWGINASDPNLPAQTVASIINVVLSFLGIITICLVIYGGFLYLFARGNPQTAAKGSKVIFLGIIGVLIVLASWGISYFVFYQINQAAQGTGSGSGEGFECVSAGGVCTANCTGANMLLGYECPVGQTCCNDPGGACENQENCSCLSSCGAGTTSAPYSGCSVFKECCCVK